MPLRGGGLQQVFTASLPNFLAAKFASQGDAHVRTGAQIKSCIIPCYMLLYFALDSYFFYSVFLNLDLLYC